MSTRCEHARRSGCEPGARPAARAATEAIDDPLASQSPARAIDDPLASQTQAIDEVARVSHAKRGVLLRTYRHLLRVEDLEDCFSQATLELLAQVRRGRRFASARHLGNTLELRFASRIRDMRRALGGRSPIQAALAGAVPLGASAEGEAAIVDRRADVEALVLMRNDLRLVQQAALELSRDQRLVIACQLVDVSCRAFCEHYGWSAEKYRKVAQRGRARLRTVIPTGDSARPDPQPHDGRAHRDQPMKQIDPPQIGASPVEGEPAVGRRDGDSALPDCAHATGSRQLPVSASGRPRSAIR